MQTSYLHKHLLFFRAITVTPASLRFFSSEQLSSAERTTAACEGSRKERDTEKDGRKGGEEAREKERESYGRLEARLTVRCRVVGVRLAVSLSTCQPTHVGTAPTGPSVDSHRLCSRGACTQPRTAAPLSLSLSTRIVPAAARISVVPTRRDVADGVRSAAYMATSLVADVVSSIRFNERSSKNSTRGSHP